MDYFGTQSCNKNQKNAEGGPSPQGFFLGTFGASAWPQRETLGDWLHQMMIFNGETEALDI